MTLRDWFRAGYWVEWVMGLLILASIYIAYDAITDPFW